MQPDIKTAHGFRRMSEVWSNLTFISIHRRTSISTGPAISKNRRMLYLYETFDAAFWYKENVGIILRIAAESLNLF